MSILWILSNCYWLAAVPKLWRLLFCSLLMFSWVVMPLGVLASAEFCDFSINNLVHGWDRIKNLHVYSLLALSIHKKYKRLPNYDKETMGFGNQAYSSVHSESTTLLPCPESNCKVLSFLFQLNRWTSEVSYRARQLCYCMHVHMRRSAHLRKT